MADEDYAVLLDDFARDIAQWDYVAGQVLAAQQIVATLTLDWGVTDGISFTMGFKEQYDAAHQHLYDYITAGQATMAQITEKLRVTRELYADAG